MMTSRISRVSSSLSSIRNLSAAKSMPAIAPAMNFGANNTHYVDRIAPHNLVIEKTTHSKEKTPYPELQFGKTFTDHMLTIDWDEEKGWHTPHITPYKNFSLSPASSVFHYAIECFEGMKAYKDRHGKVRLFRPDRNMARLNYSMVRLSMPPIDKDDGFLECIKQLIRLDHEWIPDQEGYSLYIRPTAIGTSPYLGVHASEQVKLYCILSPVGPYYKSGFKPVKLYADSHNVRAWPGGVGNAKVGGNYAPTIYPSQLAAKHHGCSQVLWLCGEDHQVAEVGAMNIFFAIKKPHSNITELITPPLSRGDILPGVTRASILELAREWTSSHSHNHPWKGKVEVSERFITMHEIVKASKEGRLTEVFGAGTAAVISPVKSIIYKDQEVPAEHVHDVGPLGLALVNALRDIQYGKVDHPWSVVIN